MTPAEFTARILNTPWRLHGCSFEAVDCWGLLVLYFRHVHGIALAVPPRTADTTADMQAWLAADAYGWAECGPLPGASAFVAFERGAPRHCGVMLPGGQVLHANGSELTPGRVQATRLAVWVRTFPDTRFFRPCALSC